MNIIADNSEFCTSLCWISWLMMMTLGNPKFQISFWLIVWEFHLIYFHVNISIFSPSQSPPLSPPLPYPSKFIYFSLLNKKQTKKTNKKYGVQLVLAFYSGAFVSHWNMFDATSVTPLKTFSSYQLWIIIWIGVRFYVHFLSPSMLGSCLTWVCACHVQCHNLCAFLMYLPYFLYGKWHSLNSSTTSCSYNLFTPLWIVSWGLIGGVW